MEKTKKELELRHIAAILFAALAVSQILGNVLYIPAMANTNFLFALLFIGGYGCIAYCLYTGRRDKVLALGFGLVAIPKVLTFLSGWFTELYTVSHWYSGMQFSLLSAVPTFLDTLGYTNIYVVVGQEGEVNKFRRAGVGEVVVKNATYVIFTSDNSRRENLDNIINDITANIKDYSNYEVILDRSVAINKAINMADDNDLVLILGKNSNVEMIYSFLADRNIKESSLEE